MAQTIVFIPPYLRNVETGGVTFFERQMAKNPKLFAARRPPNARSFQDV